MQRMTYQLAFSSEGDGSQVRYTCQLGPFFSTGATPEIAMVNLANQIATLPEAERSRLWAGGVPQDLWAGGVPRDAARTEDLGRGRAQGE